ncbi:hypothetical protein M976_03008 [Buttiauxella ferragutiae ATCC 51602]|uniref:Uncharacterized protein n=1 Tax=Buttiauxella ferragutiae ATCC 51602 TaxID=1354252 RepID=A0ABX2W5W9_9ENTR|nr:hypothetical protein [Buttiauxella ferragutiae]OAT26290.1 hypothetical protein M976_03008 [Buttiauxella ferragutiae ATCC 51602]
MSDIDDVIDSIKDEAVVLIKEQLKDLLLSAVEETDAVIRQTGEKITYWLLLRARGELNDSELEALLYARDQLLRQYKNTLQIEASARVEKIAIALVNIVLDKLLGLVFH